MSEKAQNETSYIRPKKGRLVKFYFAYIQVMPNYKKKEPNES
jgi:hypothetical protein